MNLSSSVFLDLFDTIIDLDIPAPAVDKKSILMHLFQQEQFMNQEASFYFRIAKACHQEPLATSDMMKVAQIRLAMLMDQLTDEQFEEAVNTFCLPPPARRSLSQAQQEDALPIIYIAFSK